MSSSAFSIPNQLYTLSDSPIPIYAGFGIALGLDGRYNYKKNEKLGVENGQAIILGTDGVWESHNSKGEMFGNKRVYDIVRNNISGSAKEITESIFKSLKEFQEDCKVEDDVTLVVIKIDQN